MLDILYSGNQELIFQVRGFSFAKTLKLCLCAELGLPIDWLIKPRYAWILVFGWFSYYYYAELVWKCKSECILHRKS